MRVDAQKMALDYIPARPVKNDTMEKVNNLNMEQLSEKEAPLNEAELERSINELNHFFSYYHLQFRVHEGSGRYQVKMIDQNTDEVIREWPPSTILEISARFREMLEKDLGVLLDERI